MDKKDVFYTMDTLLSLDTATNEQPFIARRRRFEKFDDLGAILRPTSGPRGLLLLRVRCLVKSLLCSIRCGPTQARKVLPLNRLPIHIKRKEYDEMQNISSMGSGQWVVEF